MGIKYLIAPKYIKEYIDILQVNPNQSNINIILDSVTKYLKNSENAYIEYKSKISDFPELKELVDEYEAIKGFITKLQIELKLL